MPTLTSPLLSADAKGQLGRNVIYYNRSGTKCARSYARPEAPPTDAQLGRRGVFGVVSKLFLGLNQVVGRSFFEASRGTPRTPSNEWGALNLAGATFDSDAETVNVDNLRFSVPSVRPNNPLTLGAATGANNILTVPVTWTNANAVDGATQVRIIGVATKSVHGFGDYPVVAQAAQDIAVDAVAADVALDFGADYTDGAMVRVGIFLEYLTSAAPSRQLFTPDAVATIALPA